MTTPPPAPDGDKKSVVWLTAFDDPVANIKTFPGCIDLVSLDDTGDNQLLVADMIGKLKVYSGVALASEHVLLDTPVACCTYQMDELTPRVPGVAVATSQAIYVYRGLRPFVRFALPPLPVHPQETQVWDEALTASSVGKADASTVASKLAELRNKGVTLTRRSLDLLEASNSGLDIEGGDGLRSTAEKLAHTQKLQQLLASLLTAPGSVQGAEPPKTTVTCMVAMPKAKDDPRCIGCLLVGTEAGQLLVLSPDATGITQRMQLKSPPVFIASTGVLDGDHRLAVACRNRTVYLIKNGELSGTPIELEVQPVALCIVNKHIFVGCMNSTVQAYQLRGRKSYTLYLPSAVIAMEQLHHPLTGSKALLVSLANGEVRLYNEANKFLISIVRQGSAPTMSLNPADSQPPPQQQQQQQQQQQVGGVSPVVAMRFGQYGRERGVLVMVTQQGALSVRILSRASSNLSAFGGLSGPPPEQDVPLKIPKKTSLYVEQTQHERENAAAMHRAFQRELYRLRLETARSYVKVLTDQQGPISYYAGSSLRLSARVQGLGPVFRMRLFIENTGKRTISGVPVVFSYNQALYRIKRGYGELPVLVPGLPYHYDAKIVCLDERGASEPITVFVCNGQSSLPIIMALVQMPQTELLFN